jgi:ubiquinone/menaquinone biosynthesis C-methylase UbiE
MEQVSNPQPTPERFFNSVFAFRLTEALKAAIELDLFTAIAEGNTTANQLAERCKASERGMRTLCDFLVVNSFLTKSADHYNLTADSSVFLNRQSPAYFGGAIEFLLSPTLREAFADLAGAVRKGGTTQEQGMIAPNHPIWVRFARAMAPLAMFNAKSIIQVLPAPQQNVKKVLDIAAGHGLYGIMLAKTFPQAEIHAVDWESVLQVALENAKKFEVSDRYHTIPGSAFDVEFGNNYDLILLTNFLHHFDAKTNENFLRKIYKALKPGGKCLTVEFVPNEDRVTPPESAAFSLTMLATTPSGDAYTFPELERMFAAAGFSRSEVQPLPQSFQHLITSHK